MSDSHDSWVQYYQPPTGHWVADSGGGVRSLSDSTTTIAATSVISENSSAAVGVHHLNPHGTVAKPTRRRSRASKRTPTTLLNASAANFRTLVQQFTGCHSATTAAPFGTRKGPLNLNFGLSSNQNDHPTTNSIISPSGFSYNYNQQSPFLHQQQQQQQQHHQYQEMLSSLNNNIDHRGTMQSNLDDFVMENNVPLHEFVEESALTGSTNDAYFY